MSEIQAGVTKRTKLIAARVNLGLSQEALAEEVGASRVAVNHWENGSVTPQPHYRGKLCAFFGVDHPAKLDLGYRSGKDVEAGGVKRNNLRAARMNKGFSQKALAKELGVTQITVNNWEKGATIPYPCYRHDLCKLLGVDSPEMLDIFYEDVVFDHSVEVESPSPGSDSLPHDESGKENNDAEAPTLALPESEIGKNHAEVSHYPDLAALESKDPREQSGQNIMLTIYLTVSIDTQNGVASVESVHIESE